VRMSECEYNAFLTRVRDSALLGTPMPLLGTHPLANYGGYDQGWPPAYLAYTTDVQLQP